MSEAWAIFEDQTLAHGFTQIPNVVTRNANLSMQAKFMYGLLLSYAWQDSACFPGLQRMREDTGAKVDTLRKYIYELKDAGLIDVRARGKGRTNLYIFKALTSSQDNPQRGTSKPPPSGEVKTTPNGGHYEYSEDKDSEDYSRRGVQQAEPPQINLVKVLVDDLDTLEVYLSNDEKKKYGGQVKQLRDKGVADKRIVKAIKRVAADWDRYPHSSLQKALSFAEGTGGQDQKPTEAVQGSPPEGIAQLREVPELKRYAPLAERFDFSKLEPGEQPPWPIYSELGGDDGERFRHLQRIVSRMPKRVSA